MKVLITGDTGFIGTNLKQHVGDLGHEVIGFSTRNGFDIMDRGQVGSAVSGVDVVIHGAAFADPAASIDQPEKTIDINLLGTLNVLKACAINDVPCTNISSWPSRTKGVPSSKGKVAPSSQLRPPSLLRRILRLRVTVFPGRFHCGAAMSRVPSSSRVRFGSWKK